MLNSKQTQRDGLIFIYDMTNSSYGNFDYELCVKILNLLKVNARNMLLLLSDLPAFKVFGVQVVSLK